MNPRHRPVSLPRAAAAAATLALVLAGGRAEAWSVGFGPSGGLISLDQELGNYRWDTAPRPAWGLAAKATSGRVGGGVRLWRSATTQVTGIPGETFAPDVRLTATEAFGEVRVARVAGVALLAGASTGALHLGWSPDRATLAPGGVGEIEISYEPVTEWTAGAEISACRTLPGGLDLALGLGRSWFRLDTQHRAGDEIVARRDTFGHWIVRAELAHRILQR